MTEKNKPTAGAAAPLKITERQEHPSPAAVVTGRREPYHLTYIKKTKGEKKNESNS